MVQRTDYQQPPLDETDLDPSPIEQLRRWRADAYERALPEPDAMCVSTVGEDGRPSSRFVLLRGLDERGLVFYTNYESRKGRELAAYPYAAAAFWWPIMERQCRIEGAVERATDEEADAYYFRRPPGSRLASAASPQSRPLRDRAQLEALVAAEAARYPDGNVPRPAHWGGLRIVPDRFEFWQGRPSRLHDRLVYSRLDGEWVVSRLAP